MEALEAYGWQKNTSVEDGVYAEGHRFDFYQAVRLLEMLYPELDSPGVGSDPARQAVRFRSKVDLAFAATDIDGVAPPPPEGGPATMTVNFMGLAGAQGPLPRVFTELIVERAWRKDTRGGRDTAFSAFLDIFNHRLIGLLYRARKSYRPALSSAGPDESNISRPFFALLGLGTEKLRGRMRVAEGALLGYAGLLARRARSMAGMEGMLEDYFGVAVDLEPFRLRRFPISADQVTKIGPTGQNQILGRDTVLGNRFWTREAAYRLRLGPMPFARFLEFLPPPPPLLTPELKYLERPAENRGTAFGPLTSLVRFSAGHELDCSVQLGVEAAEVPQLWLGSQARLGWTTWLKTRPTPEDDRQLALELPVAAGSGAQSSSPSKVAA